MSAYNQSGSEQPVKRKILDLAFYAFNQKGYKAISMDLVSQELRISKKTIYKFFESKEEILETAMQELFSDVENQIKQVRKTKSETEVILSYYTIFKYFQQSFSVRLREEISLRMPHLDYRVQAFERQVLHRSLNKWLKDCRAKKQLSYPSPTREFTASLFALMKGISDVSEEKSGFILTAVVKAMMSKKKKKKQV